MSIPAVSGTRSGIRDVTMTLRAPRVVLTFDASEDWQTRAATMLWRAGTLWGGSGFALIPHLGGKVDPALVRVAAMYDPDYVAPFAFSVDDEGGRQADYAGCDPIPETLLECCSPLYVWMDEKHSAGPHLISTVDSNGLPTVADIFGQQNPGPALGVPESLGGTIGLAMALRAGLPVKPRTPFESAKGFELDEGNLAYALGGVEFKAPTHQGIWFPPGTGSSPNPASVPSTWRRSERGLLPVGDIRLPFAPELIVVGSAAADFCLALAYHRMVRPVVWIPREVFDDEANHMMLRLLIRHQQQNARERSSECLLTSVSLGPSALTAVLDPHLQEPLGDERTDTGTAYVDPSDVPMRSFNMLVCAPEDFDIRLAMPTVEDTQGTIELAQAIPVREPTYARAAPIGRPFWMVDVTIEGDMTPTRRNPPRSPGVAGDSRSAMTPMRSSSAGVTFAANSWGFTAAGQQLRQSIARPRISAPGLWGWVQSRCSTGEEIHTIILSDAGRRASVAASLFGGRAHLAEALTQNRTLFAEFLKHDTDKNPAYLDRDAIDLKGVGGLLTFPAVLRVLSPDTEAQDVRNRLDELIVKGVVRRGTVVACAICGTKSYVSVDDLQQVNTCARCGNGTQLVRSAWIKSDDEPAWFYDLHPVIRQLLEQNGDVPVIAGAHLGRATRRSADIAEVEFQSSDGPLETDIIANVDDELIVGEAKCVLDLGESAHKRSQSAKKYVRIAQLLHADQIALCSSKDGSWIDSSVRVLRGEVDYATWTSGRKPTIRLITGLGPGGKVSDTDASGRPWQRPIFH